MHTHSALHLSALLFLFVLSRCVVVLLILKNPVFVIKLKGTVVLFPHCIEPIPDAFICKIVCKSERNHFCSMEKKKLLFKISCLVLTEQDDERTHLQVIKCIFFCQTVKLIRQKKSSLC